MNRLTFFLAIIAMIIYADAWATNTPCSGKKGGIAYCDNGRFVCHDGTISQSKKTCVGYEKPKAQNAKTR